MTNHKDIHNEINKERHNELNNERNKYIEKEKHNYRTNKHNTAIITDERHSTHTYQYIKKDRMTEIK